MHLAHPLQLRKNALVGRHMNKSALALAGFGFAAGIVLFIVFEPLSSVLVARFKGQSPNENLVRLYQELAANGIKRTLRDDNAKTEDVVFHPMPGEGREGHSYACGYVRPSTDAYAKPQRFIYHFDLDKAMLFRSLDHGQIEQLSEICNSAPAPLELFTFAGGKLTIRAK
jgi:hypothetical protein